MLKHLMTDYCETLGTIIKRLACICILLYHCCYYLVFETDNNLENNCIWMVYLYFVNTTVFVTSNTNMLGVDWRFKLSVAILYHGCCTIVFRVFFLLLIHLNYVHLYCIECQLLF